MRCGRFQIPPKTTTVLQLNATHNAAVALNPTRPCLLLFNRYTANIHNNEYALVAARRVAVILFRQGHGEVVVVVVMTEMLILPGIAFFSPVARRSSRNRLVCGISSRSTMEYRCVWRSLAPGPCAGLVCESLASVLTGICSCEPARSTRLFWSAARGDPRYAVLGVTTLVGTWTNSLE